MFLAKVPGDTRAASPRRRGPQWRVLPGSEAEPGTTPPCLHASGTSSSKITILPHAHPCALASIARTCAWGDTINASPHATTIATSAVSAISLHAFHYQQTELLQVLVQPRQVSEEQLLGWEQRDVPWAPDEPRGSKETKAEVALSVTCPSSKETKRPRLPSSKIFSKQRPAGSAALSEPRSPVRTRTALPPK